MKKWFLFAIILEIMAGAAIASDSLYATADAAKYAEAARLVLTRALPQLVPDSLRPSKGNDTVYVAYPSPADPPDKFLTNTTRDWIALAPISHRPPEDWENALHIGLTGPISADSVKLAVEATFRPQQQPASATEIQGVVVPSPWSLSAEVLVVRRNHVWKIVYWKALPQIKE